MCVFVRAKSIHSCPTLCDHMGCSPQVPLSMRFSRQEYCSGLPCPSPGDLPNPGLNPVFLHCRQILHHLSHQGSSGKESSYNAGDTGDVGSVPVPARSPGGGQCNPLQYSYLENPMDRGAWWVSIVLQRLRHD